MKPSSPLAVKVARIIDPHAFLPASSYRLAERILEASGHAELVEALQECRAWIDLGPYSFGAVDLLRKIDAVRSKYSPNTGEER